jgi:hypothetical protein
VFENGGRHCCARIVRFRLLLALWVTNFVHCSCKFPRILCVLYICICIDTEWVFVI